MDYIPACTQVEDKPNGQKRMDLTPYDQQSLPDKNKCGAMMSITLIVLRFYLRLPNVHLNNLLKTVIKIFPLKGLQ